LISVRLAAGAVWVVKSVVSGGPPVLLASPLRPQNQDTVGNLRSL
jgi:hypothetical protein